MKNSNEKMHLKQKVVTLLGRQQIDLLDKIGKDVFFAGGGKLPRGEIISALVDVLLELRDKINTKNIKQAQDLKEQILAVLKNSSHSGGFPTPVEILAPEEKKPLKSANKQSHE